MIDWENINLKELAGYVSEELRKHGIETFLDYSCRWRLGNNLF